MSAFNLNLVASWTLQLLLLSTSTTVEGFQNNNHRISRRLVSASSTTVKGDTRLFNSIDDVNDDNDDDPWSSSPPISKTSSPLSQQLEQGTFNPLNYRGKNKTNRSSGNSQAQVSLRALRMSSFTDDLLNSLGDKTATRAILEENRDFLLEPLESEDSLAVRYTMRCDAIDRGLQKEKMGNDVRNTVFHFE